MLQTVKSIHFTLPCRLIHLILIYNITPKSGSRDQITNLEMYLIWAIWSRRWLNWAGVIFNHLSKMGAPRKDSNLGYGIALFKLFENFEVDMKNEVDIHKLTKNNYFTKKISVKCIMVSWRVIGLSDGRLHKMKNRFQWCHNNFPLFPLLPQWRTL